MKKLTAFAFVSVSLFLTAILALAGTGSLALGAKAVNPQPLPPRVALNPQPLPPGAKALAGKNQVNPQPLPPGGYKTATGTGK